MVVAHSVKLVLRWLGWNSCKVFAWRVEGMGMASCFASWSHTIDGKIGILVTALGGWHDRVSARIGLSRVSIL